MKDLNQQRTVASWIKTADRAESCNYPLGAANFW